MGEPLDPSHPPKGSAIELREIGGGLELSWPLPKSGPPGWALAAFALFWLCFWAYQEAATLTSPPSAGMHGASLVFMATWLRLWATVGAAVVGVTWMLVRPRRPEKLVLTTETLVHDSGWSTSLLEFRSYKVVPVLPSARTIRRSDVDLRLERSDDRERLIYDDGGGQVEIGRSLQDSVREWIATVVEQWRTAAEGYRSA